MGDDYEISDLPCPACGHHVTHSRHCGEIGCNDGWRDEHDDDPVNFAPGEEKYPCEECAGTGIQRWCPNCGEDYWRAQEAVLAGKMKRADVGDVCAAKVDDEWIVGEVAELDDRSFATQMRLTGDRMARIGGIRLIRPRADFLPTVVECFGKSYRNPVDAGMALWRHTDPSRMEPTNDRDIRARLEAMCRAAGLIDDEPLD